MSTAEQGLLGSGYFYKKGQVIGSWKLRKWFVFSDGRLVYTTPDEKRRVKGELHLKDLIIDWPDMQSSNLGILNEDSVCLDLISERDQARNTKPRTLRVVLKTTAMAYALCEALVASGRVDNPDEVMQSPQWDADPSIFRQNDEPDQKRLPSPRLSDEKPNMISIGEDDDAPDTPQRGTSSSKSSILSPNPSQEVNSQKREDPAFEDALSSVDLSPSSSTPPTQPQHSGIEPDRSKEEEKVTNSSDKIENVSHELLADSDTSATQSSSGQSSDTSDRIETSATGEKTDPAKSPSIHSAHSEVVKNPVAPEETPPSASAKVNFDVKERRQSKGNTQLRRVSKSPKSMPQTTHTQPIKTLENANMLEKLSGQNPLHTPLIWVEWADEMASLALQVNPIHSHEIIDLPLLGHIDNNHFDMALVAVCAILLLVVYEINHVLGTCVCVSSCAVCIMKLLPVQRRPSPMERRTSLTINKRRSSMTVA